jgi:PAS domain S-box-containing protein
VGAVVAEAPSGRVLFANARAESLFRGPMALPQRVEEYSDTYTGYHASGRQYAPDEWPLARALALGQVTTDEEIEFRLSSGERRIMLVSAAPIYHGNDIIRAVSLFQDVTEQRQEERRREFLMTLSDDLRLLDDAHAIMENAAMATGEFLGVTSASYADVDAEEHYALVHAEYRNGAIASAAKYYLEDFGAALVDRLRRGETIAVEELSGDPTAAQDLFEGWGYRSLLVAPIVRQGRLIALFSVLHTAPRRWSRSDLTLVQSVAERTWHAVDATRMHAELRQSREWLSLSLRAGAAAIWEWNLRSGEIYWSEEIETLLGVSGRRALTFSRWLSLVHPDDRPRAQDTARRVAAMREGEIEFDYRVAGQTPPRWITMRGRIIADPTGMPYRIVGVAVDSTERKRSELERETLLQEARDASDAKSHFIGVISHEFRTPLTAIIGYTDLLCTGVTGDVSPKQSRQLDRIRASAWHLTQMVDEILTFSRLESGRETLSFELADVVSLARDAAAMISSAAGAKGLVLACELPEEALPLRTDTGKIRQVLLHLLSNAVKFTDRGGVTLIVRRDGDHAEFAVRDTGIGIAAADREHVFDRFWQANHGSRRVPSGAGLGLTVSRRLVEMLGGTIEVESELGVGSTFRFRIPL